MSIANADTALVKSVKAALAAITPALPIAYENAKFDPPTDGKWAAMFIIPAALDPATLGDAGQDEYLGVLQIDLNVPLRSGTGVLKQWADRLREYYKAGRRLAYNGQEVLIRKGEPSSTRRSENGLSFVISYSVTFRALLTR